MPSDPDRLQSWKDRLFSLPPEQRAALIAEVRQLDPAAAGELELDATYLLPVDEADAARRDADAFFQREDWKGVVFGGKYEILALLGEGASAKVFRARQSEVAGRSVALKVLNPKRGAMRQRELEALARLDRHPNVVFVLDSGVHRGLPYLVTEWLDGPTLGERLSRGPLPWHEARRLIFQIADAVRYLQEKGVYHRDLKPDNIILTGQEERAVLVDFGIAHLSDSAATFTLPAGTPRYMAPEQISENLLSRAGDVYSLAALLLDMLLADFTQPRDATFPPRLHALGIPAAVTDTILTGVNVDPLQRHAEVQDFVASLQSPGGLSTVEPPVSSPRVNRREFLYASVGVVAAGALGAAGAYVYAAPWISLSVEKDPLSSPEAPRFCFRLQTAEPVHVYVFSGGDAESSTPLSLLWPTMGDGGEVAAGDRRIPPQDWNLFVIDRSHPPDALWIFCTPTVNPLMAMSSSGGEVGEPAAAKIRAILKANRLTVKYLWTAPRSIPVRKPRPTCVKVIFE